jgi:hypothetical protein
MKFIFLCLIFDGEAEITETYVTIFIDKDILRFKTMFRIYLLNIDNTIMV